MEFNHSTDPNIKAEDFLVQHHLVRYYLKVTELKLLEDELENGSITSSLPNPLLKSFWKKLIGSTLAASMKLECLEKARTFISVYTRSVHKHNTQFRSEKLLFLACFGEIGISSLVAKLILGKEYTIDNANNNMSFVSSIHDRKINLCSFSLFLFHHINVEVEELQKSDNFAAVGDVIEAIANGQDIWDGSMIGKLCSNRYLNLFAALPSTTIMVEENRKRRKECDCLWNCW